MQVEARVLENDIVRLEPMEERHRELLRGLASGPELWEWTTIRGDGAHFDNGFDQLLAARAPTARSFPTSFSASPTMPWSVIPPI